MLAPTAEQYNELNARYEALRSIRETEPEAHATQMATTLEETQHNSQVLIAQLRGEIERLSQNDQEFASAVTMAESLHAENAQLRQAATPGRAPSANVPPPTPEAYTMQKTATFYEMLTGVSVSVNGNRVHCSCGGEQRPLSFEIDLAPVGDENNEVLPGDVGFTAKGLGDCADRLPEYMQDYLTCARAHARPLSSAPALPHPSVASLEHVDPPLPRTRVRSRPGASAGAAAKAAAGALRSVSGRRAEAVHARGRAASPESIVTRRLVGPSLGSTAANSMLATAALRRGLLVAPVVQPRLWFGACAARLWSGGHQELRAGKRQSVVCVCAT